MCAKRPKRQLMLFWLLVLGGLGIAGLVACRGAVTPETPPAPETRAPSPSSTIPPTLPPKLTATTRPSPTVTYPPIPTATSTLDRAATLTALPTPETPATDLPTLEPTGLPDLLAEALTTTAQSGPGGLPLLQVTGWEPGWRSPGYCQDGPYRWLDSRHLLLYPIVGTEESMGTTEWTRPVVLDTETGRHWLPPVAGYAASCDLPVWSDSLGFLATQAGDQVVLLTPRGEIARRFPGVGALALAPSGKRLLAWPNWIDLENGRTVRLEDFWQVSPAIFHPGWSSDEMQLFVCCFEYAHVDQGVATGFDLGELVQVGRGVGPGFTGIQSYWVMDDTRVLVVWDFMAGSDFGLVPLIDPQQQNYQDLRTSAGLSADEVCLLSAVAADGWRVALNCSRGVHLIDLHDQTRQSFPSGAAFSGWSADGAYALIQLSPADQTGVGEFRLVSVAEGESISLPGQPSSSPIWGPQGSLLAALIEGGSVLNLLDAAFGASELVPLPDVVTEFRWAPGGDGLALVAADGALWWVSLSGELLPLSPANPSLGQVRWSPDGTRLAYLSGADLYIVTIRR